MEKMKIGIVGLDTSHSPAFTMLLNNPEEEGHVPGCQITKAFPGGSELFYDSHSRVPEFTRQMRDDFKIEITDSIEELAADVDAILLESVDGRQHLEQFKILTQYRKPVFIDKPLACSYSEAKDIIELANSADIPIMTCSSLRFAIGIRNAVSSDEKVQSCHAFGPMALLDDYRDYFWYGIHTSELLFSIMGKGCSEVRIVQGGDYDLLTGVWEDGRIGTITGKRVEPFEYGCTLLTDKNERLIHAQRTIPWYALLIKEIVDFFKTGKSLISIDESLEVIAFLEAASRSRAANGKAIKLKDL